MGLYSCLANFPRKHQGILTCFHEPLLNRAPPVLLHDEPHGGKSVVDDNYNAIIIDIDLMNMVPLDYAATFLLFMHAF